MHKKNPCKYFLTIKYISNRPHFWMNDRQWYAYLVLSEKNNLFIFCCLHGTVCVQQQNKPLKIHVCVNTKTFMYKNNAIDWEKKLLAVKYSHLGLELWYFEFLCNFLIKFCVNIHQSNIYTCVTSSLCVFSLEKAYLILLNSEFFQRINTTK